jgi:hypothetical protein
MSRKIVSVLIACPFFFSFGQTPRKIFTEPHPRKHMFGGRNALPVGRRFGLVENYAILIQSAAPVNREPLLPRFPGHRYLSGHMLILRSFGRSRSRPPNRNSPISLHPPATLPEPAFANSRSQPPGRVGVLWRRAACLR